MYEEKKKKKKEFNFTRIFYLHISDTRKWTLDKEINFMVKKERSPLKSLSMFDLKPKIIQ